MSEKRDEGMFWILILAFLLAVGAGPVAMAERSKDSLPFRVFLWVLIRSFWFGAGALTVYLCTQ